MQAETFAFKCGKCGQNRTRYYQMQTRSADEPMTVSSLQVCKKVPRLTPYTLADIRDVRLASSSDERAQPTDEMLMLFFRCINCSNKSVSALLFFHRTSSTDIPPFLGGNSRRSKTLGKESQLYRKQHRCMLFLPLFTIRARDIYAVPCLARLIKSAIFCASLPCPSDRSVPLLTSTHQGLTA